MIQKEKNGQLLYNETLQKTFHPVLSKLSKRWQI